MKKIVTLTCMLILVVSLTGCKKEPKYDGLDNSITGEFTVMSWAGDGIYYEDIGRSDLQVSEITNGKVAEMRAVAKAFNEIYPNVKINFLGEIDGPDAWAGQGAPSWEQRIENFKAEYGVYPGVFALTDAPSTLARGLISDLSQFKDDPLYKSINPTLMNAANYYGVQSSLPSYFMPHGVFVNNGLVADENLEEVDGDWTFSEFKRLATNGGDADDGYVGLAQHPTTWARQMFIYKSLSENPTNGKYVDLNNDDLKEFYRDGMDKWEDNQFYSPKVDETIKNASDYWAGMAFSKGNAVLHPEDPWWIPVYSDQAETNWLPGPANYDYLPFPSYKSHDNSIATTIDPVGIYNYALDGDANEYSEVEQMQTKLAYTYAIFSIADTRAWDARINAEYTGANGDIVKGALGSFPVTTGDEFDEQLDLWLAEPKFAYYKEKPGFQSIVEIVKDGEFYAFTDKLYPWYYTDSTTGEKKPILDEFFGAEEIDGIRIGETGWNDIFVSKLSTWEDLSNQRFKDAWDDLRDALVTYYGYENGDSRFSK